MKEVNISYEHLEKTEAIEEYILKKMKKLNKFLTDDSIVTVKVKDETPHKNHDNSSFRIIIHVEDMVKGSPNNFEMNKANKDLYICIDETVEKLSETMSKYHEKSSDRFKKLKSIFNKNELKTEISPVPVLDEVE